MLFHGQPHPSGLVGILLLLLLAGIAGQARAQDPPSHPQMDSSAEQDFKVAVNVDLVVLHPTVRDRSGAYVSDLLKANFEVFENGVPQSIRVFLHEDIPVTVGLVVDHSGSMHQKVPEVLAAARTFVQSSNPADEMFVVNFNETVTNGLPENIPFTNAVDDLEAAIRNAPVAGQTALYDAVGRALEHVQRGSREKKVLVVVSDGGDNASALSEDEVLRLAKRSNAIIYTIGIFDATNEDRNPGLLRRLARATGGEAYFPPRIEAIVSICEQIAHDIRNQYTIGYTSNNTATPGSYRRVRVVARAPGSGKLKVRTRDGYIAAGETRNSDSRDLK